MGCASHAANIGCGAYYGRRAESDGMLCIFMSNTYPAMAPFGGAGRLVGTNPIVMAAPAGKKTAPILDISTSTVAIGKVTAYARRRAKPCRKAGLPISTAAHDRRFHRPCRNSRRRL